MLSGLLWLCWKIHGFGFLGLSQETGPSPTSLSTQTELNGETEAWKAKTLSKELEQLRGSLEQIR